MTNIMTRIKDSYAVYCSLSKEDKRTFWKEWIINNSLYIFLILAAIGIYIYNNKFFGPAS